MAGSVDVDPSSVNIQGTLQLSGRTLSRPGFGRLGTEMVADNGGRPGAVLISESISIGDFNLHFHGHWDSWLYNFIADIFKNTIKNDS